MKKNIIDTLIPAVSLEVIRFNASEILNDKEPALRALMTDKSVIVNSPTEAFEIAEKAVLAGIVVTSIETLLQDGYTTIGDVAVVVLSITLVNCHIANKQLRKTVLMQANQISEMDSVSSNYTTMYVGLVK